ncbi:hypothetical protein ACFVIM_10545 [Streptomyces sp. NPDC057638]
MTDESRHPVEDHGTEQPANQADDGQAESPLIRLLRQKVREINHLRRRLP